MMRHFKDGRLEYGLVRKSRSIAGLRPILTLIQQEPSRKAYDFDSDGLEGDYYLAWQHRRMENLNHRRHVEDDRLYRSRAPHRFYQEQELSECIFPDSIKDATISIQAPANYLKKKQTDKGGRPIWININIPHVMKLQYLGNYMDKVCTTYQKESKASESKFFEFSDSCEAYFGATRDDNGNPFLRICLEYCGSDERKSEPISWGPWELVGKKISNDGPGETGKRDLSNNEKLRLGFSMDEEGNFLPTGRSITAGISLSHPSEKGYSLQADYEGMMTAGKEVNFWQQQEDFFRKKGLQHVERQELEAQDWRTRFSESAVTPGHSSSKRRRPFQVSGEDVDVTSSRADGIANNDQHGNESDSSNPSGEVSLLSPHEVDAPAVREYSKSAKRKRLTEGTD